MQQTRPSTLPRWLARAGLAALLGASFSHWRATTLRRREQRPEAPSLRDQVWEAEGGQNQMPPDAGATVPSGPEPDSSRRARADDRP